MFCPNCGAENAEGTRFCGNCGTPLIPTPGAGGGPAGQAVSGGPAQGPANQAGPIPGAGQSTTGQQAGAAFQAAASSVAGKVKKLPLPALIGIAAAAAAAVVLIIVGVNAANTVNLNKYMTVTAEGYDGYGQARADIDWEAIEKKYGKKISYSRAVKKAAGGYGDLLEAFASPVEMLEECVDVEVEPGTGLSNGDKVTYKWEIDEDMDKYLNVKLRYKDGTYKVSDLKKVSTFEAFDDVTVTFDGVAPNGKASAEYNGDELSSYDFTIDKTDGLSNGDEVTITISDESAEACAENYGMVPATKEKTYTVEGLKSYVTKLAEVDADALTAMQSQAADVFNAKVTNWSDDVTLQDFTYIGDYLLTAKDSGWGDQNTLYLVYKYDANIAFDGYQQTVPAYWYISFSNLMVSDGKVSVDVTDDRTPYSDFRFDTGVSDGWFSTYYYYFDGYQTLDELYEDAVTSNKADYNSEENVKDPTAPAA